MRPTAGASTMTLCRHSAVIAYIVESDIVRIVNIFYGGRDYEALLRGGGEPSQ